MTQPELQGLATPVSIGAQAIQRYLGNGAPRIANPNPVGPTGIAPGTVNGVPVATGPGGTIMDQATPGRPPPPTNLDQPLFGSGSDAGNLAARNLQLQNPTGNTTLGTMTAGYANPNGATPLDSVTTNVGPTQQTAAGGVVGPVRTPNWGNYFRQRMGPPTGARSARAPLMMRQQRIDNGGY